MKSRQDEESAAMEHPACRKGQPATKPFIARVLPVALIVVSMVLAGMMEF